MPFPKVLAATLSIAILLATAANVPAQNGGRGAPPGAIPLRVLWADTVVIGKFQKVEEETLPATFFPGAKAKTNYKILTLKVEDGLRGVKKGDVLRFGVPVFDKPGLRPGDSVKGSVQYKPDQEGLFFLRKHHDENFFAAPEENDSIDKRAETYAKDLELSRHCLKLLEDPQANLTAKDANDRLLTAGMLIHRYGHYQPGKFGPEMEMIPAEESKLILAILTEADWTPDGELSPLQLFKRLDVGFKDGLKNAENGDFVTPAKEWLKGHADTFRIQRYKAVAAKPEVKK